MTTHSSNLAWRIPGTEEPGGLQSMGSHSQTRLKRLSSSSMVVLFLVFKGLSIPSSIVAVSIYIPPTVQELSLFSTPSPAFIVCRLFDDGHSDWCEEISHCGFDLHFSNNE